PPVQQQPPPVQQQPPPVHQQQPPVQQQPPPVHQQQPPVQQQPPPVHQQPPEQQQQQQYQPPPEHHQPPHPETQESLSTHHRQPPPPRDSRDRPDDGHQGGKRVPSVLLPSEPNEFDMRSISFVYRLPSRGKQCFYHKASSNFTFEYQVTSGGSLDIDVFINSPGGKLAFDRRGKAYGEASFAFDPAKSTADMRLPAYMICLDNRYSSWHDKLVYFNIDKSTDKVEDHLLRTIYLLSKSRNNEARDRMMMDANNARVSTWSIFQLVVMLFVSGIQVMMIRSLFDDKSRLHRVWKAGKS
uniref:GOLD domain-containing protein n=1 Tax=Macrostomum lignano TaxID=282301 RepID=A0A1I8I8N0_9PLAT